MKFLLVPIFLASAPALSQPLSLIAKARAKGYSFEIADTTVVYEPEFVIQPKLNIILSLKNILQNGSPITIRDEKTSPDRLKILGEQFDKVCNDLLDISAANIPEAQVRWKEYQYNATNGITALSCSLLLPAK